MKHDQSEPSLERNSDETTNETKSVQARRLLEKYMERKRLRDELRTIYDDDLDNESFGE